MTTTFGTWIKERRLLLDLTQEQLAGRVGCARITVAKIEANERRPSRQMAQRLGESLRVTPAEQAMLLAWALQPSREQPDSAGVPDAAEQQPPADRLPAPLTSLVGRDQEVVTARGLLLRSGVRLLTLTGPPGVGKTRLALAVAASLPGEFADGVYFVALAAIADPALVAGRIAQSLDYVPPAGRALEAGLADYLRRRQILLLLDNFEQVLPAAALVSDLLRTTPRLKLLATSRAVLHVYGEYQFPVTPLALPDPLLYAAPGAASSPKQAQRNRPDDMLRQYPAIALFAQRAQAADPYFELTPDNVPAVAAICARLDGLPLAIELAAARTKLLAPGAILAQLRHSSALLAGGPRDREPRQQTLHEAIAWSYHLLDPLEQAIFRRLAVFAGGCTAAAAAVVGGRLPVIGEEGAGGRGQESGTSEPQAMPSEVRTTGNRQPATDNPSLSTLESLVDKSLLYVERDEERFLMLETIREYALEQLEQSGEAQAMRRAHVAYCLELAETAEPHLRAADQQLWLDCLEREHDNLRAALSWALQAEAEEQGSAAGCEAAHYLDVSACAEPKAKSQKPRAESRKPKAESRKPIALCLAGALWRFWAMRGYSAEGRSWLSKALAIAPERTAARAKAATAAGNLATNLGDYARARELHFESLSIYRELGDTAGAARALNNIGTSFWEQSRFDEARLYHEQSLAANVEAGDRWGQAASLTNLGLVSSDQGNLPMARHFLERAGAIFRELGDRTTLTAALNNLGIVALMEGNYPAARAYWEECLSTHRDTGYPRGEALALTNLAVVARDEGDFALARRLNREALDLCVDLGDRRLVAHTLDRLAGMALMQGKPEKAARLCGAACALLDEIDARLPSVNQVDHERHEAQARAVLGDARFDALQAEGRGTSPEEAIDYGLEA